MEIPQSISRFLGFFAERFNETDHLDYFKLPLAVRAKIESDDPNLIKEGIAATMEKGVHVSEGSREYIRQLTWDKLATSSKKRSLGL